MSKSFENILHAPGFWGVYNKFVIQIVQGHIWSVTLIGSEPVIEVIKGIGKRMTHLMEKVIGKYVKEGSDKESNG
ncbi:hypothetical protein [Sediminicola sp. 1XM1-17]|uniref:hypothetical protein n=1 Tax=Sediminicola sp. 1XM1-17 TaxID=3127702 RepID=UPI003076E3D0